MDNKHYNSKNNSNNILDVTSNIDNNTISLKQSDSDLLNKIKKENPMNFKVENEFNSNSNKFYSNNNISNFKAINNKTRKNSRINDIKDSNYLNINYLKSNNKNYYLNRKRRHSLSSIRKYSCNSSNKEISLNEDTIFNHDYLFSNITSDHIKSNDYKEKINNNQELDKEKKLNNNNNNLVNKITLVKQIIKQLKDSLQSNEKITDYFKHSNKILSEKQVIIENNIKRIKLLLRPKQKKHVKYNQYLPLASIYNYSVKKVYRYYQLFEIVNNLPNQISNSLLVGNNKSNKKNNKYKEIETNYEYYIRTDSYNLNNNSSKNSDIEDENKANNKTKKNKAINNDARVQTNINKSINKYNFSPLEDKYLINLDWKDINWKEISNIISNCKLNNSNNNESKYVKRRNIIECFVRKLELSNFYQYKKWSFIEDQILKKAILYYGPKNWQQISYCLEGRNNSQCFHRWMKGINPKIKRSKWSLEEDITLGIALKIYGNNKWAKISNHIPYRTDIQCRERYCNILDPKLLDVKWSLEEDLKLCNLQANFGNKWSLIAKEFGDRTDNTCWRRFKYLKYINSNYNSNYTVTENITYGGSLYKLNSVDYDENYDVDSENVSTINKNDVSKKLNVNSNCNNLNIIKNKEYKFKNEENLLKLLNK